MRRLAKTAILAAALALAALALPRPSRAWGPATSGPEYTGTAEVEPPGSWYFEPWFYGNHELGLGTWTMAMPERWAIGLGHNLEFDFYPNFILNTAAPPTTPAGRSTSRFGAGNQHFEFKYQLLSDADTHRLLALPALSLKTITWVPTGNYQNLSPSAYNTDQFGNGTWNQGLGLLAHKRFEPFELYGEVDDIVELPTQVHGGYTFNNGLTVVPFGQSLRMVDGNLLYYAAAFEHVISSRWGFGYVLEVAGQSQSGYNLFFGRASAPAWSYLWLVPTLELTWPNTDTFQTTWGAGVALPAYQWDFPRTIVAIFTVTFYFNSRYGRRAD